MKSRMLLFLAATAFVLYIFSCAAFAQDDYSAWQNRHEHQGPDVDVEQAMAESAAGLTVPLWSRGVLTFSVYQTNGRHGRYTCDGRRPCQFRKLILMGRAPQTPGPPPDNVTRIPTRIIPLKFQLLAEDGTVMFTFDPTENLDGCTPGTTPLNLARQSPLFVDTVIQPPYWNIFYDHPLQATQFVDAQMRSEFFNWMLAENPWHNKFKPDDTIYRVTVMVPWGYWKPDDSGPGPGGCGVLGRVDGPTLDLTLRKEILEKLPGLVQSFVVFLTSNVIEYDSKKDDFLGYHDAFGNPPQIYAVAPFDTTRRYQMLDVNVLTHELGEAMNNPLVSTQGNSTPPWWNGSECQGNFEVGDPNDLLTRDHQVTNMTNGFTYHLQELAFAGWFYRIANLGIADPGRAEPYSTNGTFRTDAGTRCVP